MSDRKKHRTANEFLRYLRGNLSNQERNALEREMEADPFEKEALEGLETLLPEQAEEDILSLHSSLRKRRSRKRRVAWYSVAATVGSLLIVGTLFFQIYNVNPETAEKQLSEEDYLAGTPSEPEPESEEMDNAEEVSDDAEEVSDDADLNDAEEVEKVIEVEEVPQENPVTAASNDVPEESKMESPVTFVEPTENEAKGVPIKENLDESRITAEREESPPIIHVEAEAIPENEEISGRRSKKRSDQMVQAASDKPALEQAAPVQTGRAQQIALAQDDYFQLANRQLNGVVVSGEDMKPLQGVNLMVKGTNYGVVSNVDGAFTLALDDDTNQTIVASFVGMETQEFVFENDANIQLVMQPDAMALNEVVMMDQESQPMALPAGGYDTRVEQNQQDNASGSAQPAGGFKAFKEYIESNIQFPDGASTSDRVVVILSFTVNPSGELGNILPLRSPGEPFSLEARRLLLEGPAWIPAYNDSGQIDEVVRLRFVFKK